MDHQLAFHLPTFPVAAGEVIPDKAVTAVADGTGCTGLRAVAHLDDALLPAGKWHAFYPERGVALFIRRG